MLRCCNSAEPLTSEVTTSTLGIVEPTERSDDRRPQEAAARHQLAVLRHSNRRFRPPNRLLWLILRRIWPQWRDALVPACHVANRGCHADALHAFHLGAASRQPTSSRRCSIQELTDPCCAALCARRRSEAAGQRRSSALDERQRAAHAVRERSASTFRPAWPSADFAGSGWRRE